MAEVSTTQFQVWIERMNAGDSEARRDLVGHACERLRRLSRKMLRDFPHVQRWEQSSDVLQNAAVRLLRALETTTIDSVAAFFRLAALQIRRELIDMHRHYFGPEGSGANHATDLKQNKADSAPPPAYDHPDSSNEPGRLALWTEFHQRVEDLPDELRAVFDLVWYHELPQADVAQLLEISVPTVKRRLHEAKFHLMDLLDGAAEKG